MAIRKKLKNNNVNVFHFFKANDRSVGRPNGSHLLYKGNRTNTITKQNIQIIFARFFFVGLCGITDTNIVNAAFILVSWHNHKFIDFWQQVGGLLKVRCTIILHSQCQQSVSSKCNEVYMLCKTLISFHT